MSGNSSEPGVIPKGNTGGGFPGGRDGANMEGYASRTILMTAILVLILAMVLGFLVHMYARWCWVHYAARRRRRQRRDTNLSVQDSFRPNPVSVGLDKAAIESLPIFVYQPEKEAMARKEGGEGHPECAVCLSEFKENEKGRSLPKCKHVFHTDCIDMWFQSHSTCPLCRVPVVAPLNHPPEQPLAATTEEIHQREASEQNANPAGELEPPASSSEGGFNNRPLGNNPGVEYPTNVLFWGDHAHVSSRISALSADPISQTGGNSPHSSVDIPDSSEVSANNVATERIDSSGGSNSDEQTSFSPVARLKSIKRLLSRDRRVNPADQDNKDPEQDVGVSDR